MSSAASYPCRGEWRVSELLIAKGILIVVPLHVRAGLAARGLVPSVVSHYSDRAASAFLVLLP